MGVDTDSMWVEVMIGIPEPNKVNKTDVLSILPHGTGKVTCVKGIEIENKARKDWTVMVDVAAVVYLNKQQETKHGNARAILEMGMGNDLHAKIYKSGRESC